MGKKVFAINDFLPLPLQMFKSILNLPLFPLLTASVNYRQQAPRKERQTKRIKISRLVETTESKNQYSEKHRA
jgi:hypothetical protein